MTDKEIMDDEINLADYFSVIFKHKFLVLLGTILPTLLVGLVLYLSPRDYTIAYTYDSNGLSVKNYKILKGTFYSQTNLKNLAAALQENNYSNIAEKLLGREPKKVVKFSAFPEFIDSADFTKLEELKDAEVSLLNITITYNSKKDIYKIAEIVRKNFEQEASLGFVLAQMPEYIRKYVNMLADIDEKRYSLELLLKKQRQVLAGLKAISPALLGAGQSQINLQFDVGSASQYLPLSYQVQAAESEIVKLNGQIAANEEKYKYYSSLLGIYEMLNAELKQQNAAGEYLLTDFKTFVDDSVASQANTETKDCLMGFSKRLENRILTNIPVVDSPMAIGISKGLVKKSVMVFVIAFMLSVFAAFVRESLQKA